jgi:hypothetical protein
MAAAPGAFAGVEAGERGDRREEAAREVAELEMIRVGGLVFEPVVEHAGDRLVREVVRHAIARRTVLAKARDRHVNERGIDRRKIVVARAESRRRPWAEALQHNVGRLD